MEMNEYQMIAQKASTAPMHSMKVENGLMGMMAEIGECAQILRKYLYNRQPFGREQMVTALGNIVWNICEVASGLEVSLETVAQRSLDVRIACRNALPRQENGKGKRGSSR